MPGDETQKNIFRIFADLLEYPRVDLSDSVRAGEALVAVQSPDAALLLRNFYEFLKDTPLGRLQEIYTSTFDLDATYHPYVGHHLFGETYKRSAFMVGLKECYKTVNLDIGSEVADNLAMILRYLSLCDDASQTAALIHEALLPAMEKMIRKGDSDDDELQEKGGHSQLIYKKVVEALQMILQKQPMNSFIPTAKTEPSVG
jgi:nitrate reductase delta subunit